MPFKKTTTKEIEAIVKEQGIESEYKETGLMFENCKNCPNKCKDRNIFTFVLGVHKIT